MHEVIAEEWDQEAVDGLKWNQKWEAVLSSSFKRPDKWNEVEAGSGDATSQTYLSVVLNAWFLAGFYTDKLRLNSEQLFAQLQLIYLYRGLNDADCDHVTLAFFGGGTANNGQFFECLNMAALWKLSIIFVVENNLWAIALRGLISRINSGDVDRAHNRNSVSLKNDDFIKSGGSMDIALCSFNKETSVYLYHGLNDVDCDHVTLAFFGGGTANNGQFFECLNMAALWKLSIIFVVENNLWAIDMSRLCATLNQEIWKKGPAIGMPGVHVDGMEV
nr:pyruvate dehydrogenase E1 component subunit alpha-3, chloroplastic [Tanacetum cinerariifolium]